jgi:hypothetical protein
MLDHGEHHDRIERLARVEHVRKLTDPQLIGPVYPGLRHLEVDADSGGDALAAGAEKRPVGTPDVEYRGTLRDEVERLGDSLPLQLAVERFHVAPTPGGRAVPASLAHTIELGGEQPWE